MTKLYDYTGTMQALTGLLMVAQAVLVYSTFGLIPVMWISALTGAALLIYGIWKWRRVSLEVAEDRIVVHGKDGGEIPIDQVESIERKWYATSITIRQKSGEKRKVTAGGWYSDEKLRSKFPDFYAA